MKTASRARPYRFSTSRPAKYLWMTLDSCA